MEGKYECSCSVGGFMSAEHWLFDCGHCAAQSRRGLIAAKARVLEERVRKENKNVAQKQLVSFVEALSGGESVVGTGREGDRKEAFRAAMGLFRTPEVLSKEAMAEMTALAVAATESLFVASRVWSSRQEEVAVELRKEGLGRKWGRRWLWRMRLQGAWKRSERVGVRSMSSRTDWDVATSEWWAMIVIGTAVRRRWRRRLVVVGSSLAAWAGWLVAMEARVAFCASKGTSKASAARLVAAGKRKQKKAAEAACKSRTRSLFNAYAPGNCVAGEPFLAEGLLDVEVSFRRKPRKRWRGGAARCRASNTGGSNSERFGGKGRTGTCQGRTRGKRKRKRAGAAVVGRGKRIRWEDMSDVVSSSDEEHDAIAGREIDRDGCSSAAEVERGGAQPVVAPKVDDRIRVFWTEDAVWFRARVKKVDEVCMTVEYTHVGEGWRDYVHKWGMERWEQWTAESVPDPAEATYCLETWDGEVDLDARRARLNAMNGAGDRGARRQRREEAARERMTASRDGAPTDASGGAGRKGRTGGAEQVGAEEEEEVAGRKSDEACADSGSCAAAPKPQTGTGRLWCVLR